MTATQVAEDVHVRELLATVLRRWWLVALTVLVTAGAAFFVSQLQDERYRSRAEVLVGNGDNVTLLESSSQSAAVRERTLANEIAFIEGRQVSTALEDQLGFAPSLLVSARDNSDVVTIEATADDPERAALAAQTTAEIYVELRNDQRRDELSAAESAIQGLLDDIEVQIEEFDEREDVEVALVDAAISDARQQLAVAISDPGLVALPPGQPGQPGTNPTLALTDQINDLERARAETLRRYSERRDPLLTQRSVTSQELLDVLIESDLASGQSSQILRDAEVPQEPFTPQTERNVAAGIALGVILGLGLVFLSDQFDPTVRTDADVLRVSGHRVLATLRVNRHWAVRMTRRRPWRWRKSRRRIRAREARLIHDPRSTESDAYQRLRTVLEARSGDSALLQLTSCDGWDHRVTEVGANLASTLARAGHHVILVEADVRQPRLSDLLSVDASVGLTDVVEGRAKVGDGIQRFCFAEPKLDVMVAGPTPTDPAQVMGSAELRALLAELGRRYDKIVLTCPPLLSVADSVELVDAVVATVLVATAGKCGEDELQRSVELLDRVNAPFVGTTLVTDYRMPRRRKDRSRRRSSRRHAHRKQPLRVGTPSSPRVLASSVGTERTPQTD